MKTEGYIANHLSTGLKQVTALVLAIHTYRRHTMNGTIQKKKYSRSDFQGLLFVFECIVLIILKIKFPHYKDRPSLWNYQYRELRIMPKGTKNHVQ